MNVELMPQEETQTDEGLSVSEQKLEAVRAYQEQQNVEPHTFLPQENSGRWSVIALVLFVTSLVFLTMFSVDEENTTGGMTLGFCVISMLLVAMIAISKGWRAT